MRKAGILLLWGSSLPQLPEIEQPWAEEAERRLDEIESGEAGFLDGPQVMREHNLPDC